MKRISIFAVLALALCLNGRAKARDLAVEMIPSISASVINDGGAQGWTNTLSGSEMGMYSGAGDITSSLSWSLPLPVDATLHRVTLRYRPTIANLEAAPDCTVTQLRYSGGGFGNTLTATSLGGAESSGCAVTKDVSQHCTVTLSAPARVQRGDRYQLACTFNQSATGRVFIAGVGVYGLGR